MGRPINLMREQADYFHFGPNVVEKIEEFSPRNARLSLDVEYFLCPIPHECSKPRTDLGGGYGRLCVQLCPMTPDSGDDIDSAVAARLRRRSDVKKERFSGLVLLAMGGRTQEKQRDRHYCGWAQDITPTSLDTSIRAEF